MARLPASEARESFSEVVNQVAFGGERVVLQRHGKDVAAIVPVSDLRFLEAVEDKLDLEAARRALSEKEPPVAWKKLKRELGI